MTIGTIAERLRRDGHQSDIIGQIPVFIAALAIFTVCGAILLREGMAFPLSVIAENSGLYPMGLGLILAGDVVHRLAQARPASPIRFLLDQYRQPEFVARIIARLPLYFVLATFLPLYALMKPLIPAFQPYSWDTALIAWDRAIFFGHDAWEVLQPVLGYPIVTASLAVLYHMWFLIVYPGSLFILFARSADSIRRQYFLSFLLIWMVIGFALAIGFSSVGPCFVEPLFGDTTFSAQMAYLNAANEQYPIMVLPVQDVLLTTYLAEGPGRGIGISAMPSMHVAAAFLFWLTMRKISRPAGWFFFAFFVVIWIGSVHIAYHYAVDGLVSVVAVAAIWWVSRQIIGWWDAQGLKRAQAAFRTNTVPAE